MCIQIRQQNQSIIFPGRSIRQTAFIYYQKTKNMTTKKRIYDIELQSGFILTIAANNIREAKSSATRQLRMSGDSDRINYVRFSHIQK